MNAVTSTPRDRQLKASLTGPGSAAVSRPGTGPVLAVEQQLEDAARRALRMPSGRMALVLHLSRLAAPAPRAHHRRIARAILNDTAQRHDGAVFAMFNGDLVLLCRGLGGRGSLPSTASTDPHALPGVFEQLFRSDSPEPNALTTIWGLEREGMKLVEYLVVQRAHRPAEPVLADDVIADARTIDSIDTMMTSTRIADLMQRQTAVLLVPGGPGIGRLRPLFREVTFSVAALEARIAAIGQASADPFLFRHLAGRLDVRMFDVIGDDLRMNGPLAAGARDVGPTLHLNLTLAGILSPAFARFADTCSQLGARVGIEISLLEACADPAGFREVSTLLAQHRMAIVLDGVSQHALLMTSPRALNPDLVKLDWSPRLMDPPPQEQAMLDDAIAKIGPGRVVLQRAETESALRWGLANGIRRFQGRHIDAMLAAGRLGACAHAGGCTLRQCVERAAATGAAGRIGCQNTTLLDAGTAMPALEAVVR